MSMKYFKSMIIFHLPKSSFIKIKYILLSCNKDKGIFEAEKALNISFSILGGIYMIEIT